MPVHQTSPRSVGRVWIQTSSQQTLDLSETSSIVGTFFQSFRQLAGLDVGQTTKIVGIDLFVLSKFSLKFLGKCFPATHLTNLTFAFDLACPIKNI